MKWPDETFESNRQIQSIFETKMEKTLGQYRHKIAKRCETQEHDFCMVHTDILQKNSHKNLRFRETLHDRDPARTTTFVCSTPRKSRILRKSGVPILLVI
jgi:hypothetical protein